MPPDEQLQRFSADAAILAQIGAYLFLQPTRMKVRLPRELAEAAVLAWQREEVGSLDEEAPTEKQIRGQAGTLALIGLSVERSTRDQDEDDGDVVVELDAWFIGAALDAADEAGLITR